jgi:hypothetical protein
VLSDDDFLKPDGVPDQRDLIVGAPGVRVCRSAAIVDVRENLSGRLRNSLIFDEKRRGAA